MKPEFGPGVRYETILRTYPGALQLDITGHMTVEQARKVLFPDDAEVKLLQYRERVKGPLFVFCKVEVPYQADTFCCFECRCEFDLKETMICPGCDAPYRKTEAMSEP